MPDMELKIKSRREQIEEELDSLPELPAQDVLPMVVQRLNVFSTDMLRMLNGGSTHNSFQSSFSKLCDQFRDCVVGMRPGIQTSHPLDKVKEVIEIDDDSDGTVETPLVERVLFATPRRKDDGSVNGTPTNGSFGSGNGKKHARQEPGTPTPAKRPRATGMGFAQIDDPSAVNTPRVKKENDDASMRSVQSKMRAPSLAPSMASSSESRTNDPFADILRQHKGKTNRSLAMIRKKIQEHAKAGLVGVVSPQVYTELCLSSVQSMNLPYERLLALTIDMLRQGAHCSLENAFDKYKSTQLFRQSYAHLKDLFDSLAEAQEEALAHLYELESENDFTVNKLAFDLYRQEEGAQIVKFRDVYRAKLAVEKMGKTFKNDEGRKNTEKEALKDLPIDPFETELSVAAYVRGYYKTAALRFVESVCLSIQGKLFKNARKTLDFYLPLKLDIYGGGKCPRAHLLMVKNAND
jgi:hypothetical protein